MNSRSRAAAILVRCMAALAGAALFIPGASANETLTYGYDALGRLVKVARTGTVNNNASECYAYDPASNRSNVTVSTTSDCSLPAFSINDTSATEGGTVTFTVTRSGATTGSYTVNYATAAHTATAGTDYTTKSGTLTFAAGVTTQTVQVTTVQDSSVEGNEDFYVNLSSASSGAGISDSQGVGTIVDDDQPCTGVSFTISSNGAVTEGTSSGFTVTKAGSTTNSCTVNYATAAGTATAGSDYTTTSGTLTFTSAQTSKSVTVPTIDDSAVESAETFTMSLSSPGSGSTLGSPSSATGTINDNDAAPPPCSGVSFTISNGGAVSEGATSVFTVTKSGAPSGTCSVDYTTANGTAVSPGDYTFTAGTLNFVVGTSSLQVGVPTAQDALSEGAETFTMALSNPTAGATVGTPGSATATINNAAANNPPNAVNDTANVKPCAIVTTNVVANDSDPDGDPISVVSVTGDGFTVASSTSVRYAHDGVAQGAQGTYTIQDSHGATDSATLTISVLSGQCP